MNKLNFLIIYLYFLFTSFYGQQAGSKDFNFWLGEWNLSWIDKEGNKQQGKNVIRTILNDKIIEENFSSFADDFKGKSYSAYDSANGIWKQTWVDNSGGYLDFTGKKLDDKMILTRKANIRGKMVLQRMVWYNISEDSLDWNWELSGDNGETWEVRWKIHYARRK